MKKAISLLLALVMCLSLCACGGGNDAPETTEAPIETTAPEEIKMSKEDLLSVAVPMTQDVVGQIREKGTGKDFAKTLISNTYTFTGNIQVKETDYVGVMLYIPNDEGKLVGYDYLTLSFYLYLPTEELESIEYDDRITVVGKISDVFREERTDPLTNMPMSATVFVMNEAYITE